LNTPATLYQIIQKNSKANIDDKNHSKITGWELIEMVSLLNDLQSKRCFCRFPGDLIDIFLTKLLPLY
jgi:hypothetical protein